MRWGKRIETVTGAVQAAGERAATATETVAERVKARMPADFETARAALEDGGRRLRTAMSREEALGRVAVGAFAIGALAVGAVAVGAFAIGRLSVGQARIGAADIGRLRIGRLEVGEVRRLPDDRF